MDKSIDDLLEDYFEWYKRRYTVKQLKNAHEIVTPFVNHINDRISLFVNFGSSGDIRITDDGVTLDELSMHNVDIKTSVRQKILNDILRNFNLELDGDIIFIEIEDQKDFMQAKHNITQGILQIYDILFTTRTNVIGLFKEEVLNFFFDNEFAGVPNPDLLGESGIKHNLDYSIGATKKRPLTLIKLLQNARFTDVAAQKYISDDLKKGLSNKKTKVKYVIIANDKDNKIPNNSKLAAKDIGIELLPWSDKERIKLLKGSN